MEKWNWLEANKPDAWRGLIEATHASLFDPEYLFKMGDIYRREFAGESFDSAVTTPTIPRNVCRFSQAPEICAVQSGFDLPLLITPKENWDGKVVAIASQDPLRKGIGWPNGLSMCTPWGFSASRVTSRGGKILWPAVEWLCRNGYGVYFTDVWKLYVEPSTGVDKTLSTKQTEKEVFSNEIAKLDPDLWIAFGQKASSALCKAGITEIDRHPHPTAYGSLKKHYGTPDERFPTIQKALIEQISNRLR